MARETPEPLTPVVAFLDKYGLANTSGERHAARKEALTLARAALRAVTPDPEACPGCGSRYADEAEMYCSNCGRAATPDPAEPTGFRPGMSYGNGGNVLSDRAASAAEPGLRRAVAEVITALDAWGTADGLIGARAYADSLRAALSDTTEGQS
jgi:hypothetical protein